MTRHVVSAVVRRPAHEVAARLAVRPADWLTGFLVLARYPSSAAEGSPSDKRWFVLGESQRSQHDLVSVPLTWRPTARADLFTEFTGQFVVAPAHGSESSTASLTLEGDALGGEEKCNEAVVVTLVDLLLAAFSEATH